MVDRCIIKLLEGKVGENRNIDIAWYQKHPGDMVENTIKSYIEIHLDEEEENNLSLITSANGYLIYIYWNNEISAGISLSSYFDLKYKESIIEFVELLSDIYFSEYRNWDDIFEMYVKKYSHKETTKTDMIADIDWIQNTLEGGEIELLYLSKDNFISTLEYFLSIFRWSYFFIEEGKILHDKTILKFIKPSVIYNEINYEDYYIRILGEYDTFNLIIDKLLILMRNIPYEKQLEFFRHKLSIIHNFFDETLTVEEQIDIIKKYFKEIVKIDLNFAKDYISRTIGQLSGLEVNKEIVYSLIEISDILDSIGMTDVSRLFEATALEVTLNLPVEERKELLLIITEKTKKWGINSLISFINSIIGILSDTDTNKDIIKGILELIENDLRETWDGLICLVDVYLNLKEYKKAVNTRFIAADRIIDKNVKIEDIISAIIWANKIEIDDRELFEVIVKYLPNIFEGIDNLEIFEYQVKRLVNDIVNENRIFLMNDIVSWIEDNFQKVKPKKRLILISLLEDKIEDIEKYNEILIKLKILRYDEYLRLKNKTNSDKYLDKADSLLRLTYNYLDPESHNYLNKLRKITEKLIFSAVKQGVWEMVVDATERFELMCGDDKFFKEGIIQIYLTMGEYCLDNYKNSEIAQIGLKLYDELSKIALENKDYNDIILKVIPNAKKLALLINEPKRYQIYSELNLKLIQDYRSDWLNELVMDAKNLLSIHAIDEARELFVKMQSNVRNPIEEYEILNKELELAKYEIDYLEANQIILKRKRLIELAENNDIGTVHEILNHFEQGTIELLAKGNTSFLHEYLLDAIRFCVSNNITEFHIFSNTLLQSLSSMLNEYTDEKSYIEIIYVFHRVFAIFMDTDYQFPIEVAYLLIYKNLEISKENDKINSYLIQSFDELGHFLHINKSKIKIFEDINEKYKKIFTDIVELINKELSLFELSRLINTTGILMIYLDLIDMLEVYIKKIIGEVHKSIINHKEISSNIIIPFYNIHYIISVLSDDDEVLEPVLPIMSKIYFTYIDSLLSDGSLDVDAKQILKEIQRSLIKDPKNGFLDIGTYYNKLILAIDKIAGFRL